MQVGALLPTNPLQTTGTMNVPGYGAINADDTGLYHLPSPAVFKRVTQPDTLTGYSLWEYTPDGSRFKTRLDLSKVDVKQNFFVTTDGFDNGAGKITYSQVHQAFIDGMRTGDDDNPKQDAINAYMSSPSGIWLQQFAKALGFAGAGAFLDAWAQKVNEFSDQYWLDKAVADSIRKAKSDQKALIAAHNRPGFVILWIEAHHTANPSLSLDQLRALAVADLIDPVSFNNAIAAMTSMHPQSNPWFLQPAATPAPPPAPTAPPVVHSAIAIKPLAALLAQWLTDNAQQAWPYDAVKAQTMANTGATSDVFDAAAQLIGFTGAQWTRGPQLKTDVDTGALSKLAWFAFLAQVQLSDDQLSAVIAYALAHLPTVMRNAPGAGNSDYDRIQNFTGAGDAQMMRCAAAVGWGASATLYPQWAAIVPNYSAAVMQSTLSQWFAANPQSSVYDAYTVGLRAGYPGEVLASLVAALGGVAPSPGNLARIGTRPDGSTGYIDFGLVTLTTQGGVTLTGNGVNGVTAVSPNGLVTRSWMPQEVTISTAAPSYPSATPAAPAPVPAPSPSTPAPPAGSSSGSISLDPTQPYGTDQTVDDGEGDGALPIVTYTDSELAQMFTAYFAQHPVPDFYVARDYVLANNPGVTSAQYDRVAQSIGFTPAGYSPPGSGVTIPPGGDATGAPAPAPAPAPSPAPSPAAPAASGGVPLALIATALLSFLSK